MVRMMSEIPRFGQRSTSPRQEMCPKHRGVPAVAYCKRCNRPACADCAIQTDVGALCVDCAGGAARRAHRSAGGRLANTQFAGAPATLVLVVANVAIYVLVKIVPDLYQTLALSPALGFVEPWRLFTSTFLHLGFFHILFNMLMLYLLGAGVERAMGTWRFLSVYLLSALGGSMAVIAWVFVSPSTWTQGVVGASGAIYGLFGAIFVSQRRSGMSTNSILILLGINLAYGFIAPGISWQAHLGGFLAGLLASAVYLWVVDYTSGPRRSQRLTWEVLATFMMFAVLAAGTWGMYALLL